MKYNKHLNVNVFLLPALFALIVCLANACATQKTNVIPDDITGDVRTSFDQIAEKLDNPCAEQELQKYNTLAELVRDGKKCHESWLISETISFFLQQSGYGVNDVYSIAKAEMRNHLKPAKFNIEGRPKVGRDDAPAQIVIFSDFQCPYCSRGAATLKKIAQDYVEDTQIIFKNMPLINIHPLALPAAICAIYANTKGKFWEVHDKFFENQKQLNTSYIIDTVENDLGGTIEEVYDPDQGHDYARFLSEDMDDASNARVQGTPTFFVNGIQLEGGLSFKRLAHRIEAEKTAPPIASEDLRILAQKRILQKSPFVDKRLTDQYNLLTDEQKATTSEIAGSIPCPCPDSFGTIEDCANISDACPAASMILSRLMQRLIEHADENAILDEIQSLFAKARLQ